MAQLVAFFLAGLILLGACSVGGCNRSCLLSSLALFASALGLTSITDNVALTYLRSLIENIPTTQSACWSLAVNVIRAAMSGAGAVTAAAITTRAVCEVLPRAGNILMSMH